MAQFPVEIADFVEIRQLKEALEAISNASCGICDPDDYHGNYRIYEIFRSEAERWLEAASEAKVRKEIFEELQVGIDDE
jgi:hypothetical protein